MALRLVTPTDGPAPSRSAPAGSPRSAIAALVQRADAQLRAHDVDGWRVTFDGAGEIADVHGRYVARRALLDALLAVRGLNAPTLADAYLTGARAACDVLDEDVREPQLLNTAGILFFELGATAAAEALFHGAGRLDPDLEHLAGNLAACKRRRKAGNQTLQGLPPHVLRELRTLGPRAQRLARAATPATGLTLSLCMIVKDEEAMLPKCLASVRDYVDEIIVVDTGSRDRTVEIAQELGAKVLHHEWTGDFSAARNVSFEAATGDWMMFLDADEVLVEGDGPKLRALTGKVWREALFLVETNHTGDLEDGMSVNHNALRIFRNRPEYRFKDRIHEQIAWALPNIPERLEVSGVRIEHYGYLGVVREGKEKSTRNIELLERQVAEGGDSPFLHFNLGSEYGALADQEKALEHFRAAWARLESDPGRTRYGFYPSFCARFVKALHLCGHCDEALATGDRFLAELPGFSDIVFEQAWALRHAGRSDAAVARFERAIEMGDAPSKYSAAVGAGTFLARTALADLLLGRGDAERAAEHLRRCLEDHPRFIGAVEPYARVLLRLGRSPAETVAEVHALAPELTPGARFLLAVPLYEAGATAEAEAELRLVLAAQPGGQPARLALAEALLSQRRFAEAAEEAQRIPADAPIAPLVARTLLFARLADPAAGADDIDGALDYAQRAGLPPAERAAFAAWRSGEPAPGSVPAAAAPLLATMLEALARLEDFDGFERLAGVAEALALPWRERRELMAGVYLRRGFLDSACEEWIQSVEREGADRRAMLGLATIAELRGLPEDAAVFRAEAEGLAA